MSDEKQKLITTLPNAHYATGMLPTTSFRSMFASDDSNSLITGLYGSPNEQYFSAQTMEVMGKIRELEINTLSASDNTYKKSITLDEQLFDARAEIKILLSTVSMHFSEALRKKLFRQIDLLHDPDDWDEGDEPIQLQSFNTFLRWFYLNKPSKLPNFGLSAAGHFIASWLANDNKDRLILEFMSNDRITYFVTKYFDEGPDRSSGSTYLSRIADRLASYQLDEWFTRAM